MYGFPDSITATTIKRGANKMSRYDKRADRVSDLEALFFSFLVIADFFMSIFRGIALVVRKVSAFFRKRAEMKDRKARAERAKAKLKK